MEKLEIVPATEEDAEFVATVMLEAVGEPVMEAGDKPEKILTDICRRTDTLYTWQNAVIVKDGDQYAGGLISYAGEGYHETKLRTFGLVPKEWLTFDVEHMEDETRSGEYYLDSLAVMPQYRGKGVGSMLLEYGAEKARRKGLPPILACDPDNTNAYNLYTHLGFVQEDTLFIFGHDYLRMVYRKDR